MYNSIAYTMIKNIVNGITCSHITIKFSHVIHMHPSLLLEFLPGTLLLFIISYIKTQNSNSKYSLTHIVAMVTYYRYMHANTYLYMKVPNYAMMTRNEVTTCVKK